MRVEILEQIDLVGGVSLIYGQVDGRGYRLTIPTHVSKDEAFEALIAEDKKLVPSKEGKFIGSREFLR